MGNLGYPTLRVFTSIKLLMPTFSLLDAPPFLTEQLHRLKNAPLPLVQARARIFGQSLEPRYIFGAESLLDQ